jgi:adenylosuccinate synthase
MRLRDNPRVIVLDLGFGDAGKGTVTDFLVRHLGARAVVRFNGGAQAGHNVVTRDGRHHTFAQLGAGTFVPGVRTFLSKHVVFHPTALLVEAEHLARTGVPDALGRITVSEECLVTTPFHQAATCVRELARGDARHGSCGVGLGETMQDALGAPDQAIRAKDLRDAPRLARALGELQRRKRAELSRELASLPDADLAATQRRVLEDPGVVSAWIDRTRAIAHLPIIEDDARLHALLASDEPAVFEGAQGVLLDEWVGFHPFTTWSTCTFDNAVALLAEHASPVDAFRLGVLRSYATRHGAGPFPTACTELPPARTVEHNATGPWQGAFREGWLDAVLAKYAVAACGRVDGLAVTHLDRFMGPLAWRAAVAHEVTDASDALFAWGAERGQAARLRQGPSHDLDHVARLATALATARPVYEELDGRTADPRRGDIVAAVARLLAVPVALTSHGPTADEKTLNVGVRFVPALW